MTTMTKLDAIEVLDRVAAAEEALAAAVAQQAEAVRELATAVGSMRVLDGAAVEALASMGATFRRMQAFQESMVRRSTAGIAARVNAIAALGRELEDFGDASDSARG